jgi:hypothetical protein
MSSYTNVKDPNETLDYGFNLADWLETGDALASASFSVETGLTEVSESTSGNAAAVMVSGGTASNVYTVKGTLATDDGRVLVRRIRIYCAER